MSLFVLIALIPFLIVFSCISCGLTAIRFPGKIRAGRRIACAGDSITYGCGIPLCYLFSYPRQLGRLLGKEYCVRNFGVNDADAQSMGNKPYVREKACRNSLAFAPEIVVLMLGSNDTKAYNWESDDRFKREYKSLITAYTSLPSVKRVILCAPPASFRPVARLFSLTNDVPADRLFHLRELIKEIGAEMGLTVIDLYTATLSRRDLLGPDGLHPNRRGAAFIAGKIKNAIGN